MASVVRAALIPGFGRKKRSRGKCALTGRRETTRRSWAVSSLVGGAAHLLFSYFFPILGANP